MANTHNRFAAGLLLALLTSGATAAQDSVPDLDTLLSKARAALAQEGEREPLQISGKTEFQGQRSKFRWTFSPAGFFYREIIGPFSTKTGYDGRAAWTSAGREPAVPVTHLERERLQTLAWLYAGTWCIERTPFELTLSAEQPAEALGLDLRLTPGVLHAQLLLDPKTFLLREARFDEASGGGNIEFSDWRSESSPAMPWRVTLRTPGLDRVDYVAGDARIWDRGEPNYSDPQNGATDTSFLEGVSAKIETKQLPSGRIFVRPLIDGKQVGWFLFDPNMTRSVLSQKAGNDLMLVRFGEVVFPGFDGIPRQVSKFRQTHAMQLGPLMIDGPLFLDSKPMEEIDAELGEPCAGALGWDVLMRAVVQLDLAAGTLSLFNPATFDGQAVRWEPLTFTRRRPQVAAELPGKQGAFLLDLRRASNALQLAALGNGEQGDGKTIDWVQIAGQRVKHPDVQLESEPLGWAAPYNLGSIGRGILPAGPILLHYGSARIGFPQKH